MTKNTSAAASRRQSRKNGSGDYPIGKGKPPPHTRFQPGQSGNPKGRKKNQPTVHDQVTAVLRRKIDVPDNGVIRKMTLQETMFLAVGQKAVRGDLKAIAFLLNLREATRDSKATTIDPTELAAFDQATLRRYMQAVIDRETSAPCPDGPVDGGGLIGASDAEVQDGADR